MVLWLKNIPHKTIELDLVRPVPSWFLLVNPSGRVPTLMHDGKMIDESDVLNEYLDEAFPEPPLLPRDPYRRALSRQLINHGNRCFVPALYELLLNQDRARDRRLSERALAAWRWIDDFLIWHNEGGEFLFDAPSLADLSLAPFVQRYAVARYYRYLEVPATKAYERVRRWRRALLSLPVVQATCFSEDDLIKAYEDYALGYGNAEIPPGRARSSFDLAVPLEERRVPARPPPQGTGSSTQ
jgi:glutathione S-transferase